jgi:hypothetical protein
VIPGSAVCLRLSISQHPCQHLVLADEVMEQAGADVCADQQCKRDADAFMHPQNVVGEAAILPPDWRQLDEPEQMDRGR